MHDDLWCGELVQHSDIGQIQSDISASSYRNNRASSETVWTSSTCKAKGLEDGLVQIKMEYLLIQTDS